MESNITLFAGFLAGVLTFLSPCVLPLIPAYISYITGASVNGSAENSSRYFKKALLGSAAFVLGFSAVFVLLGLSFNYFGQVLGVNIRYLKIAAGVLVVFFGLHMAGIIKLKFLYRQFSFRGRQLNSERAVGVFGAVFMGMAFAFAWTPCVGPVLASILMLAGAQTTAAHGGLLLFSYSLGIGVPFMLAAMFIGGFFKFFQATKKYFRIIEIISGIMLVAIGVLIITGGFDAITRQILQFFA
ncbi:MAG: cytochrome c biogenesis protein CcdA [Elusimicrobia bacterium]|nr:cytochrome c biogenesis protein CcdA [Elusimicrobiota bacterium]